MASTITASDASITITESISLGGVDRGGTHTRTISSVSEMDRRVMEVSSSAETSLIDLDTSNGKGQFVRSNIRYIRITNLDDSNWIRVRFMKAGAETADVKVLASSTFMLSDGSMDVDGSAGSFSAFVDIDDIKAQANGAACDVELVVLAV
jgi:hypothetical protein|tara:strand:+ start:1477 stop:1929 length:453 start_codon:yes stop_codon:yes gene_type:complete